MPVKLINPPETTIVAFELKVKVGVGIRVRVGVGNGYRTHPADGNMDVGEGLGGDESGVTSVRLCLTHQCHVKLSAVEIAAIVDCDYLDKIFKGYV